MKIKNLKYHQIDFDKYNYCVENAYNSLIYAYSWYLDIVAKKNWNILVLDDYKAVMPLPYARIKRKFFKKMIAQPILCQQLGVFAIAELNKDIMQLFLDYLKNQRVHNYHFNANNTIFMEESKSFSKRNNFELDLNKSYKDIIQNYSKNLQRNLKKATKNELTLTKDVTINQFIEMKKNTKNHLIDNSFFKTMEIILNTLLSNKNGFLLGVTQNNTLIAVGFFSTTNKRIIHLVSASNAQGKKLGASAFLFNSIIKKQANQKIIFDFEGSMLTGVARFFKSFGSENNPYYNFTN